MLDSGAQEEGSATRALRAPGARPLWLGASRTASLPPLHFADASWFADRLDMTPQLVREVHDRRAMVRLMSGFPWPDAKPSASDLAVLFAEGHRWPMFTRALARAACLAMPQVRKRETFSPFQRRAKEILRSVAEVSAAAGRPIPGGTIDGEVIRLLDQAGDLDILRDTLVLYAMTNGLSGSTIAAAREVQALADLMPYLDAAAEADLACDFDWNRDCRLLPPQAVSSIPGKRAVEMPPSPVRQPNRKASARSGKLLAPIRPAVRAAVPVEVPAPEALLAAAPDYADVAEASSGVEVSVGIHEGAGPQLGGSVSGDAPPAATPGPEIHRCCPVQVLPPPGSAAMARWLASMDGLARAARRLGKADPSPPALAAILPLLRTARDAAREWETENPPLVDASVLRSEVSRLAAAMVPLAGEGARMPDTHIGEGDVAREAAEVATQDLAAASAMAEEAEAAKAAALELMARGDLSLLREVNEHAKASRDRALAALARLRSAGARLAPAARAHPPRLAGAGRPGAVSPPSCDEVWWSLPGPARFTTTVVSDALAGSGVALVEIPAHPPRGLVAAISARVSAQHGATVILIDASLDPSVEPLEALADACDLPTMPDDLADLVRHPSLGWSVVIVEGLNPHNWQRWRDLLSGWSEARAATARPGSPGLVLVAAPGLDGEVPGARVRRWMERVSRLDTQSHVERLMGWPGGSLIERVAVSTAVELAAWDRGMAEVLADLGADKLLDPSRALGAMAGGHVGRPATWDEGLSDVWDGRWTPHVLSLCAADDTAALSLRLWRAQVREVFPFLDVVRSAFLRKHEAALASALPLCRWLNGRNFPVSSLERLEFVDLSSILRGVIGEGEAELLAIAHQLRCPVAHYSPAPASLIRQVSELWEDLSDGFDLRQDRQ